MAETTVVNWGFIKGVKDYEMFNLNAKSGFGYDVIQQFVRGTDAVTTGEQEKTEDGIVFLFAQRDPNDIYTSIVTSALTYIAEDFSYVATTSGSKYYLSGEYVNAEFEAEQLRGFGIG